MNSVDGGRAGGKDPYEAADANAGKSCTWPPKAKESRALKKFVRRKCCSSLNKKGNGVFRHPPSSMYSSVATI